MAVMIMSSSSNSNAIRVSSISAYAIKTLGEFRGRAYVRTYITQFGFVLRLPLSLSLSLSFLP